MALHTWHFMTDYCIANGQRLCISCKLTTGELIWQCLLIMDSPTSIEKRLKNSRAIYTSHIQLAVHAHPSIIILNQLTTCHSSKDNCTLVQEVTSIATCIILIPIIIYIPQLEAIECMETHHSIATTVYTVERGKQSDTVAIQPELEQPQICTNMGQSSRQLLQSCVGQHYDMQVYSAYNESPQLYCNLIGTLLHTIAIYVYLYFTTMHQLTD